MAERERGAVTVASALASATRALSAASDSPRLDAELLLAAVLGTDRGRLVLDRAEPLDGGAHERFDRLARRRLAGEPVAYLLGRRGFRTLELRVDPRALIPRPETEELVQAALDELPSGASVIDVGTGSGAIALALAAERPDLRVRGIDLSPDAIALATVNRLGLGLDVTFRVGDLLAGSAPADAVLANLPYVAEGMALPVDVLAHEPSLALFGGGDGLSVIRRLADELAARSWPRWLGLEIGADQGEAVRSIVADAGFAEVELRRDLAGHDRVVIGRR